MAEHDPYNTRTTRRRGDTQPTERLDDGRPAQSDPVNPDWRGSRVARRSSRAQKIPSSRQEFVLWLQFGGWRMLLAAAVLVAGLIGLIWITRRPTDARSPFNRPTEALADSGAGSSLLPAQATVTPGVSSPTQVVAVQGSTGGAQFRVFNTEGQGLFLRQEHSGDSEVLKTLPDGTVVTIAGPDFSGPDRVWKNVREPDGSTGWVAADFLQAVQ
ncbi:MAG: SH3 domain-containing protein [Kouleothrix sp.]|nr:SH3 domain-containing protein [Kouleothrix sp.]